MQGFPTRSYACPELRSRGRATCNQHRISSEKTPLDRD